jgi:hypothetical protein
MVPHLIISKVSAVVLGVITMHLAPPKSIASCSLQGFRRSKLLSPRKLYRTPVGVTLAFLQCMNQWEFSEIVSSLCTDPTGTDARLLREFRPYCQRRHKTLTRELVESRARELSEISGRDWRHISESDRDEARCELVEALKKKRAPINSKKFNARQLHSREK